MREKITDEELAQWAENRADDAGHLARELIPYRLTLAPLITEWPVGTIFRIEHDLFLGTVIGHYQRRDGKRGVVGQHMGNNIVHVYGEKWLKP